LTLIALHALANPRPTSLLKSAKEQIISDRALAIATLNPLTNEKIDIEN
jgi:hypothetical protein